jgi:hypothetical protein
MTSGNSRGFLHKEQAMERKGIEEESIHTRIIKKKALEGP